MYDLCIIGFGISGIPVARWAKHYNLKFKVLEKNKKLGGNWYENSYPDATLQTVAKMYSYSDLPLKPFIKKTFADRDDILEYLNTYVNKYEISDNVSYNSMVTSTEYNDKWIVKYKIDNEEKELESTFLCVCSGFYSAPKIPVFKNMDIYKGDIKHVSQWSYTGTEKLKSFKNKNILVIGNGPSGCDIACLASKNTNKNVTLLYRSSRWLYNRNRSVKIIVSYFTLSFCLFINRYSKKAILYLVYLYNLCFLTYMKLNGYTKTDWLMFPDNIPNRNNITLNEDIFDLIEQNKLTYKKGEIKEFKENSVTIYTKNGEMTYKPDLIIMATGYHNNIKFMNYNEIPKLYKRILSIEHKNCGFIGFVTTYNWAQTSDLQARWFIEYIMGNIEKPTKEQINKYLDKEDKFFKIHNNIDYHDYGNKSYKYCDNLAKDLNIKNNKKDKFSKVFLSVDYDYWAY